MTDVGVPITRLDAAAYTIPTDAPESDGTLAWESTTLILVEATGGNRTGIGWTYAAAAAKRVIDDLLSPVVLDRSAFDVPGSHATMTRAVRNAGLPGISACAIAAVDIALWDLKAKLLDLPLAALLGAARPAVPVYGSGGAVCLAIPNLRHLEWFHDHVRIESMLFEGVSRPVRGKLRPDLDAPGLGVAFRRRDAEQHRVG
jgi:L-alanine-DL-glutamate epimerase-like enolase superfamily enzyme